MLSTLMVGIAANSVCLAVSGADVDISGTVDIRYSNANDKGMYTFDGSDVDKNGFYHRTDINLFVPISQNVSFTGSLFAGSRSSASDRLDNASVTMAMVAVKKGKAEYHIGRLAFQQGLGLTGTTPYFDGVSVGLKNDKLTTTFTVGNTPNCTYAPDLGVVSNNRTYYGVDAAYKVDNDKMIIATLRKDDDKDLLNAYNTITFGYQQKLNQKWVVSGEYGRNDSNLAQHENGGSADAFFARIKYQGAISSKVGSSGASLTYIKADPYFDPCSNTLLETTPNGWNYPTNGSNIDNIKGVVASYERTVFENTVFTIDYAPVKRVKDVNGVPDDRSYVMAKLKLSF